MPTFNFRIVTLFVFIVICWGVAWPINKIGLSYMSPLWYTASRLLIGSSAMLAIVIAKNKFSLPHRKDIPLILIIGLLQITVYILLTNIGLTYLPAGRSSLLGYTAPFWVMPIATLFCKEKSGLFRWLGFFLGIIGLFVLMTPWQLHWSDEKVLLGSGCLLLASLCWGISIVCVRYMKWSKSPLELIPWQLLIGGIPMLILAWLREPLPVLWNPPLIFSLLYTGVVVTGISYWCAVIINKEVPVIVLSLGFLVVPVFSFIISALFLKESMDLLTFGAMLLILLGLFLVVFEKQPTTISEGA